MRGERFAAIVWLLLFDTACLVATVCLVVGVSAAFVAAFQASL